jgi:hypothetical protein
MICGEGPEAEIFRAAWKDGLFWNGPYLVSVSKLGKSCGVWLSAGRSHNFGSPRPNAGEGPGGEGDSHAVTVSPCLPASGRTLRERFGNQ